MRILQSGKRDKVMVRGKFITFEGGEGNGKSTQVRLLADPMNRSGWNVKAVRSPGGTKVGEKLRLIAENRQIICITHLPQIAAVSDCHYLIQKETDGNTVETRITVLDHEASVRELARMLGGANVTGKILESAEEMKELAKRER